MTRKVGSAWEELVELVIACSDAHVRNRLVAHALVSTARARAAGVFTRGADGRWDQSAVAGELEELPGSDEIAARVEAESPAAAWPAGTLCVDGTTAGERWILVAASESLERTRDELEAVVVLMRVCRAGEYENPLDEALESAGTALPTDARHAADVDRERERVLRSAAASIEAVAAPLRRWGGELDAEQRASYERALDEACGDAVRALVQPWTEPD